MNWVYRFFTDPNYVSWIGAPRSAPGGHAQLPHGLTGRLCAAAWVAGLIQTATYGDFFYYYLRAWRNNEKLALPV